MLTMDDQFRFKDFGLIPLQDHVHPMTPAYSNNTLSIPGRPGLWDFGEEIGAKEFEIPLGLIEYDRIALQAKLNEFVAFLYDRRGKPREFKVIFDYEPDKYYMVKCRGQLNPNRMINAGEFALPLVAYDPYKRLIVDADEITWGSEIVKFNSTSINFGHTAVGLKQINSPQTVTYTVLGQTIIPTLHIIGTANGLTLTSNGKSVSLPNFSNANWVIDGNNYTVTRNGTEMILDDIDFIEFFNGENELNITGSNMNFSLTAKYKDKFL